MTRILGIETSCDETAAAVVEDGRFVHSSVVSSQVDLHARFGGVVPEVASRAHVELINVGDRRSAGRGRGRAARARRRRRVPRPGPRRRAARGRERGEGSRARRPTSPTSGVNHLEAHLYAAWLEEPDLEPPLAVLIVSGGHTMVVVMEGHGRYRVTGQTVDDAAGEAFDKVARHLGLGYPGGPEIDRLAASGDPAAIRFPRAMPGEADFSFAGHQDRGGEPPASPSRRRSRRRRGVVPGGGRRPARDQAARLRPTRRRCPRWRSGAGSRPTPGCGPGWRRWRPRPGGRCSCPPLALCTDNGAMIAATAWWRLEADGPTSLHAGADPNLRLV